jgi:hypothetical protein
MEKTKKHNTLRYAGRNRREEKSLSQSFPPSYSNRNRQQQHSFSSSSVYVNHNGKQKSRQLVESTKRVGDKTVKRTARYEDGKLVDAFSSGPLHSRLEGLPGGGGGGGGGGGLLTTRK